MFFQKFDAFSIPIFYGTLGEQSRSLNKELVHDILKDVKNNTAQKRSGVDIHQTFTGLENQYKSFNELKQAIDQILLSFPVSIGADSYKASSVHYWANVDNSSYGFNMPHSHGAGYVFSIVYFPSSGIVNEGKEKEEHISSKQNLDVGVSIGSASHPGPGNLVLLDPIEFCKSAVVPGDVKRFPYWGLPLCITPKEGTLIMFPSYLPHMVTPTKNDTLTRISVACNIILEQPL